MEETDPITLAQYTHKKLMKVELIPLAEKEEQSCRQKCEQRWLGEGDINYGFFHHFMAENKQKSTIM